MPRISARAAQNPVWCQLVSLSPANLLSGCSKKRNAYSDKHMRHLTTFKLIDAVARSGSIRKAAEDMALTPSALHRRLQAFEDELGEQIFERMAHGVQLNAAGEVVIHHIRGQIAETERLKSRLADLSGVRRGHVRVACSQALAASFLPHEIATYRKSFPAVTFNVEVLDHQSSERALSDYSVDLAFIYNSNQFPEFEVAAAVQQNLVAILAEDHPLAGQDVLRLRDCLKHPLALPNQRFGGRQLLQKSIIASSQQLHPDLESNSFEFLKKYVLEEHAISFHIPIGVPKGERMLGLVSRSIDTRDVLPGTLYFGHKRGRLLPVASARFADQVVRNLTARYPPDTGETAAAE